MVDEVTGSPLLVVAAALIRGGQVLVQQRPADKSMAGLWEFPGGKVEAGESCEAALCRELKEELGIQVRPEAVQPCTFATGRVGDRPMLLLLYVATQWQGEPRALEAPRLRWVGYDALSVLPMPPADVPLVAALRDLLQPAE